MFNSILQKNTYTIIGVNKKKINQKICIFRSECWKEYFFLHWVYCKFWKECKNKNKLKNKVHFLKWGKSLYTKASISTSIKIFPHSVLLSHPFRMQCIHIKVLLGYQNSSSYAYILYYCYSENWSAVSKVSILQGVQ